jgi:peptidyl-prolyl cis-trans isomerase A (cyclophilin A)
MFRKFALMFCALLFSSALIAAENPRVLLSTSLGDIEVELDQKNAPLSAQNFLAYVDSGFYNGTIFHRVISGFMVQGGGFDGNMEQKQTRSPIPNEANNGLRNLRGTLAMARTSNPNSATSQFFINHKDNAFLDYSARDAGYAVFGKVVRGMEVVDKIAQVPTSNRGMNQDVPRQAVEIISAKRL